MTEGGRLVDSGEVQAMKHLAASTITAPLASREMPTGMPPSARLDGGRFTVQAQAVEAPVVLQALFASGASSITCTPAGLDELFLRHYEVGARWGSSAWSSATPRSGCWPGWWCWAPCAGPLRASYRTSFPSTTLREAAVEHSLASDLGFLGLRDVVAPFTDRRFWVLGAWLGVCLLLRVLALLLQRGREYGSALLRPRGGASRRMRVRGPWGLAVRPGWISGLTWLLGTGVAAALLTGMGRGAVERARSAPLDGGVLGASLGGDDPALSHVHFRGLLMGALIAVAGILVLQAVVADERSGRAEVVLATGRRRWEVVLSRAGWSLLVTLVLCATTALVVGLVAESELGGEANLSAAAWRDVLGQWPAVALVVALATLLVSSGPKFFPAAWFIWGAAAFVSLLGEAVDLPDRVIDIGPFEHSPAGNALVDFQGCAILTGLALVALMVAVIVYARRDLHAG